MIDMNRITKQCLAMAIGTAAFILLLGYAGSYEYAEEVCLSMPDIAYENIILKLGDGASNKEIAAEYMGNREYYDNLEK